METVEIESEPSTETMPETIPETIPETMPETMPEIMPETMPETMFLLNNVKGQRRRYMSQSNRSPIRDYLLPTSNGSNRCEKIDIGKKLLDIITDNVANICSIERILQEKMLSEFNNNGVQHFRCGAHILNLGVEEEIKKVSKEIQKAREFFLKL
ncbi:19970_t:CDS:2 [Cetraspora pellucida]|uniref:19970_t:CDS:1 n=1 Tax=Cetraspora pellucida TaxID=1433469 RepID=A0A9N9I2X7_9GLOM|nr:19970_t:CDS:2 [Cetraspora pellucida]